MKNEFCHWVGTHRVKYGVHKMMTALGITKGLSLNLGWDKCDVWLVDQWVLLSLCAFVCLSVNGILRVLIWWLSMFHAWLLYLFEILTCWLYWSSLLHILAWCYSLLYAYYDYLNMVIDFFVCLSMLPYHCLAYV